MRKIDEIVIHTSATRPEWMAGETAWAKRQEIKRWHTEGNGWRDIGYHFLIDRDGVIAKGRPVEQAGAHVKGNNATTIGICLIGGHGGTKNDKFFDHYTQAQWNTLKELLQVLRKDFPEVKENITGHNQYANKGCPCFFVPDVLPELLSQDTPKETPKEGLHECKPENLTKEGLFALLKKYFQGK